MLKATLNPPQSVSVELTLLGARRILLQGHAIAKERAKQSRKRSLRYARYARAKGFQQGYKEGQAAAQDELKRAAENIRKEYSSLVDIAWGDLSGVVLAACQELIRSVATTNQSLLLPWIEKSLAIMKHARSLKLIFHPRYDDIFASLQRDLPSHISTCRGMPEQQQEFILMGDSGSVQCSWRDLVEQQLMLGTSFSAGREDT